MSFGTDRSYSSKNFNRASRICSNSRFLFSLGSRAIRPKVDRIEIIIGEDDITKTQVIQFVHFFDDFRSEPFARLASRPSPIRNRNCNSPGIPPLFEL